MTMEKQLIKTIHRAISSSGERGQLSQNHFHVAKTKARKFEGIVIGALVGRTQTGECLVDFSANPSPRPLPARPAVALEKTEIGQAVVLMFEDNDPRKPIVMGVLQNTAAAKTNAVQLQADDERIVITADREIVLRCGDASITLTKAGKILIRGAYVLSRSSGVNRIKGGSVQIN
jgi:Domain of unknown function (DUF6484)